MEDVIKELEKEGVSEGTIRSILLRDLAENEKMHKKVKWIRRRQIISICLNIILIGIGVLVYYRINKLIETLIVSFFHINEAAL